MSSRTKEAQATDATQTLAQKPEQLHLTATGDAIEDEIVAPKVKSSYTEHSEEFKRLAIRKSAFSLTYDFIEKELNQINSYVRRSLTKPTDPLESRFFSVEAIIHKEERAFTDINAWTHGDFSEVTQSLLDGSNLVFDEDDEEDTDPIPELSDARIQKQYQELWLGCVYPWTALCVVLDEEWVSNNLCAEEFKMWIALRDAHASGEDGVTKKRNDRFRNLSDTYRMREKLNTMIVVLLALYGKFVGIEEIEDTIRAMGPSFTLSWCGTSYKVSIEGNVLEGASN